MREIPLLLTGPMVRAVLAEDKTQTRRANALEYFSRPENDPNGWRCARVEDGHAYMVYKNAPHKRAVRCPYGQPGDRLWVREAHYLTDDGDTEYPVYAADDEAVRAHLAALDALPSAFPSDVKARHRKLRPSIYMPRWACRLALEVTRVRVERLQAINHMDALAEGVGLNPSAADVPMTVPAGESLPRIMFRALWEQVNGAGAWDSNPWVWVVEFRRI